MNREEQIINNLSFQIAQLAYEKAILQVENEELRHQIKHLKMEAENSEEASQ